MFRISQAKLCLNFWIKYDVLMSKDVLKNQAAMKLQTAFSLYLYTYVYVYIYMIWHMIYIYICALFSQPRLWDETVEMAWNSEETFMAREATGANWYPLQRCRKVDYIAVGEGTAIRFHQILVPVKSLTFLKTGPRNSPCSLTPNPNEVACYVSTICTNTNNTNITFWVNGQCSSCPSTTLQ